MSTSMKPLIRAKDIQAAEQIIFIDARSGSDALQRYSSGHLKGALHVDLDLHLSQKPTDPAYGGRHPLPDVEVFARFLGKLGITPRSSVIVYDDKGGANAAARFWWMLRAFGHTDVRVVDGGLDALIKAELPMFSGIEKPIDTSAYPVTTWQLPTVTIEEVAAAVKDPGRLVIDVREAYRYRGEKEPIDLIAGHIPGAVNIPYLNNLTPDGNFKPSGELAEEYSKAIGPRDSDDVIVHCGSGVTACHTLLALEQAGIQGANLYVGSWGEWSRRDDRPIATGNA